MNALTTMGRWLSEQVESASGAVFVGKSELRSLRAAVAELVEKSNAAADMLEALSVNPAGSNEYSVGIYARQLRDAIACFGAQS
ncbi:MAG TPA: hypothetical protein VFH85_07650 [Gammaproteobacteria bacterium]|nr:hypothetical protein [Gammaproteobacteria bacterium]